MRLKPFIKGLKAESFALKYLLSKGVKFKSKNYHSKFGEIDLIMQEHNILLFIEVRFRSQPSYGSASDTVNLAKQKKIIKTAQLYLLTQYKNQDIPQCRFDVIALSQYNTTKIIWIKDAFINDTI